MRLCRFALAFLSLFVLGACGGGGADVAGTDDGGGPQLDTVDVLDALVQDCLAASTDELLALLEVLEPYLDPAYAGPPPGYSITGVDLVAGTVSWAFDLENDGQADATGTTGFRTSDDGPYVPPDLIFVLGDLTRLQDVLGGLPDGTILRSTFDLTRGATASGSADVSFANPGGDAALPHTSSGTISVVQPDCTTDYTWTDAAIPDLAGGPIDYPSTVIDLGIDNGVDQFDGSIAFDGTSTAMIEVALDGAGGAGDAVRYTLDLETGMLTPLP